MDGDLHRKEEVKIYDKDRAEYLASLDIQEIRFWNSEVLGNTKETLDKLNNKIKQLNNKK